MTVREARRAGAVSRDGTEIAYWTSGDGPPLVLVHGAPADHTRWRPLLPLLEQHVTVHAVDRRGRGASGDGSGYRLAREHEDVAAVVDAVAAASPGWPGVDVYGHSFGGLVAFGAAALTENVRRLVLYEGWPAPDPAVYEQPVELLTRMERLLAEDDPDGVVEVALRSVAGLPDEEVRALRAAPSWPGRVQGAWALPRELAVLGSVRLDPEQAARVRGPVLLVTGEESSDPARSEVEAVAAALPDAQQLVLPAQRHVGDILDPVGFAERLLQFLHGTR